MEQKDLDHRRRRLSNLFNPPEEYPESSSSGSTGMDEDTGVVDQHDSTMIEQTLAPLDSLEETDNVNGSVIVEPATLRRSGRKKTTLNPLVLTQTTIRTVKLTAKSSDKAIKDYYLDKKVKRTNPSLETIYEEPQVINNEEIVMSTRKFKRVINFSAVPVKNSTKVKKRKVKAKSLKPKLKNKKVTIKSLMDKLNEIDE